MLSPKLLDDAAQLLSGRATKALAIRGECPWPADHQRSGRTCVPESWPASPASASPSAPIPCGTPSQFICWNPAPMFAPFSYCSVTAAWRPQPVTCGSLPAKCARHPVRSTCYLVLFPLRLSPLRLSISERRARGSPEAGSGGCISPLRRSLSSAAWRVDALQRNGAS